MSEVAGEATGGPAGVRSWRRVASFGQPLFRTLFADPLRQGRLDLRAVARPERHAAILGVTALLLLFVSVLGNEAWRGGDLVSVGTSGGDIRFVPETLLPPTVIMLFLSWVLIGWALLLVSLPWRVLGIAGFLLLNAVLSRPGAFEGNPLATRYGPDLALAGYVGVPIVLALYSIVARRDGWAGRARPVALGLMVLGLVAMFGSVLWIHEAAQEQGIALVVDSMPLFVDGAILSLDLFLLALVFVAGVFLVDFSYTVAEAVTVPARAAPRTVAVALLVALLATKLWIQLLSHLGEWAERVTARPLSVVLTFVALVAFAGVWILTRRMRAASETDAATVKEPLFYGSAVLLSAPALLSLIGIGAAEFMVSIGRVGAGETILATYPFGFFTGDVLPVIVWGAVLVAGVAMWARARKAGRSSVMGLGLMLVGGWTVAHFLPTALGASRSIDERIVDIAVSVAVLGYVAVRWRRLDTAVAVRLSGLVVFTWLVTTRGDWLSIIGGFLRLPPVFLLVVGIVFTLLAGSAFASGNSRHLPRNARPLLWVGYLLLSLTITNWVLVTHGLVGDAVSRGFYFLGIPLGLWLVVTRPFGHPTASSTAAHGEAAE